MSAIDFYKYPAQIKLSEDYACNLTLPAFDTVTKSWHEEDTPKGKIEVSVPYDVWHKHQKAHEKTEASVKTKASNFSKRVQKNGTGQAPKRMNGGNLKSPIMNAPI